MERILEKPQNLIYDERLKEFDDATTELAEMLDGSMRTPIEFYFDGVELRGRDGRRITEVTRNAIDDTANLVHANPNLLFEYRRRIIERDEVDEVINMVANINLPNTLVVISDFPPELQNYPHDVGGYNVSRQQSYLRVYARQTDGNVKMWSQSLDQSNRPALEAIYSHFGLSAQTGELLGQRIAAEMLPDEQAYLIDSLTGVYDRSMSEQFGGQWRAGRQCENSVNTYDFVCGQTDLVEIYMRAQRLQDKDLQYSVVAAMQNRYKNNQIENNVEIMPTNYMGNEAQLQREIAQAGVSAKLAGRNFSACGVTLEAANSTENDLKDAGFGNKTEKENKESKYSFDKKMFCVVCQAPPKKEDDKKMCGPCGICKDCDTKLKKKV